jgi:hypothetical protein
MYIAPSGYQGGSSRRHQQRCDINGVTLLIARLCTVNALKQNVVASSLFKVKASVRDGEEELFMTRKAPTL